MPNTISRYILRRVLVYLFAMTGLALLALLLERMIRVMGIVANWDGGISLVARMLLNLVPHYLGMALPAAFFFGVLLTFNHMNRNGELAVLQASGLGLTRLLRPVIGLALVLAAIAAVTFSHLQPYGRYAYRAIAHDASHVTIGASVMPGKFFHSDDLTFMAERVAANGLRLEGIFVHERGEGGSSYTTTADEGSFQPGRTPGEIMLLLRNGVRTEIAPSGATRSTLTFDEYRWPIGRGDGWAFRARGKDERELTLPELRAARTDPPPGLRVEEIDAEYQGRIVHILSVVFLPFLAMPLGLGGGRGGQTYGIGLGVLALVVYEQALQFGLSLASKGFVSPLLGLWLPFLIFAGGSLAFFLHTALRIVSEPLGSLPARMEGLLSAVAGRLPRFRRPG
ncbi:MAG: LptF/LptG family permease [Alphaproteobacteria bacterium]